MYLYLYQIQFCNLIILSKLETYCTVNSLCMFAVFFRT